MSESRQYLPEYVGIDRPIPFREKVPAGAVYGKRSDELVVARSAKGPVNPDELGRVTTGPREPAAASDGAQSGSSNPSTGSRLAFVSLGEHLPLDRPSAVSMSWEEYERLEPDVRHQYIDGCLVVTPRPRLIHQVMLDNLASALRAAVPAGYLAVSEWAWKPGADEWAPDVMICERPDEIATAVRFTGTPVLIVEILSTDRSADLVRKLYRYAAAGLPRYWIGDPLEPSVRAFLLTGGMYEEVGGAVGDEEVEFDFGVGRVTLRPSDLIR